MKLRPTLCTYERICRLRARTGGKTRSMNFIVRLRVGNILKIPDSIRRELGWHPGAKIDVNAAGHGKLCVQLATREDFFARGREIARLANQGKLLPDA